MPFHHALQLFDSPDSRAEPLLTFMRDGVMRGESVVMIVQPAHWDAIRRKAREHKFNLDVACAAGSVLYRDATAFAAELLYCDQISWPRFQSSMGRQVRELAETGGVRVYGEAVDQLVRQNAFDLAEQLEGFWNRLGEEVPMTLFCGYSSEHFGNPRDAASLRRICGLHAHCSAAPSDALGSFLLKTHHAC